MLKLLMIIILMNSMIILMLNHPLSMGLTLLAQTIAIALTIGFFSYNFWFSYILFLILIGGMLVLFIYMTSVASNEKFSYSMKTKMTLAIVSMTAAPILLIDSFFPNLSTFNPETLNNTVNFTLSLNKFLNLPSNVIMYMMIIYLLITLIAIVKITSFKNGPLRHYN
uniref:NADH-ubiquinone oxidoreductase chain 6 n=1 Tax=Cheironitis sp. MJTNT-2012 TaxID=2558026 RepID=S4SWG4_9SCAR|nr:NADH dehydrogenase subunit 6 [Propomacrus bimucronatus]AFQ62296.1 NADH dehydrogenase subunit 6 [Cheironitis sp. MJTNT-2012]WBP61435.1 NADH dehydrogenase subunit 6 [Propomacrus bimucronatus]